MSFDVILPFLRPIEGLIKDPEISEIMVNGPSCVFIEREGQVEPVPGVLPRLAHAEVDVGLLAGQEQQPVVGEPAALLENCRRIVPCRRNSVKDV